MSDYNAQIGERLSHIREVLSISQKQIASEMGLTRQTIANYESGRTPMRVDVLRVLCEIYGITPAWVLGIEDGLHIKREVEGRKIELVEVSVPIESPRKKAEVDE